MLLVAMPPTINQAQPFSNDFSLSFKGSFRKVVKNRKAAVGEPTPTNESSKNGKAGRALLLSLLTHPALSFVSSARLRSYRVYMEENMINKFFKLIAILAIGFMAVSADGCPQEAPQSFEKQNGLLSQKQFDAAREAFEEVESPQDGLGIHFNESSCL